MAFTAPRTWASGEIATAANMNTHVRDNMKAAAGADKAACRIYHSGSQTINNATLTAVAFNSERFDTQTLHSTSTNTERMTIPAGWGGHYLIGYTIEWAVSTTGYRETIIRVNGSTHISDMLYNPVNAPGYCRQMGSTLYALVAGDYIEIIAAQDSGAGLAINATANSSPEAWCIWMGSG